MKNTRLSHSQVLKFLTCGRLYKYHYIENLRPKTTSGALFMGSAVDKGLNSLLEGKSLEESIIEFDKAFEFGFINNVPTKLAESDLIVYAKRDFDKDLLTDEDLNKLEEMSNDENPLSVYADVLEQKEKNGFENLTDSNKRFYNLCNWLCLRRKGHWMLKAYQEKVLPKIKKVLSVQKTISIENEDGDKITGFVDLIVEWEDGKRYVLDNKTSYMQYEADEASRSQQLILYYHACKEEFKLDGVGFIVLYKAINKNKVKICSICKNDGTGKRFKTCDAVKTWYTNTKGEHDKVKDERCNGEWTETIKPDCHIDVILNTVTEAAENLVIETFDSANENIKKEAFGPNLEACFKWGRPCDFYAKCWSGKDDDLVKVEKK